MTAGCVLLDSTAISTYLFRSIVHTVTNRSRLRLIAGRERMLILGGAVADPLLRTVAVCGADLAAC